MTHALHASGSATRNRLWKPATSPAASSSWMHRSAHAPVCEAMCDRSFWRARLSRIPLVLDLPLVRPDTGSEGACAFVEFDLGSALANRVRDFSRNETTTPFTVLLAAWSLMLARESRQDAFVVGCAHAGGRATVPDHALLVCAEIDHSAGFRSLVRKTAVSRAEAANHSETGLSDVLEAIGPVDFGSRHPVFQTAFIERQTLTHQPSRALVNDERPACDLVCVWQQAGDAIRGRIEFLDGRVDALDARRMAALFLHLLRAGLALPVAPVRALPIPPMPAFCAPRK